MKAHLRALHSGKHIQVKCMLIDGFDFPTNMCSFKQIITIRDGLAQFQRLRNGRTLVLEDLLTMRNVFQHCVESLSPNGWREGDSREVAECPHCIKKDANTNLITATADLRIFDDMRKKRRTTAGSMNVVVSSEEEGYSGKLEHHRKRRINYVRPFVMMATILASPSASSPSIAHVSSLIVIHDSFLPSTPPSSLSPIEEPLGEVGFNVEGGELFSWREYLNAQEFPYNLDEHSLSEFVISLQVLLAEASMVSLDLSEGIGRVEATKRELENNFQDPKESLGESLRAVLQYEKR
ncbi:hypothetical protein PVK06_039153 [Gossypium arboreum]|uniref:Uncharacterized protein n=1 Tax=Gossypium arboreum TaxID=29729 RepID=A0ABR0N238_GOSAR|nr:hypothetical protein PVK06_039153 [Gossypium arboreum]